MQHRLTPAVLGVEPGDSSAASEGATLAAAVAEAERKGMRGGQVRALLLLLLLLAEDQRC